MIDIIKKLLENQFAISIFLVGCIRELRLWHKQILEFKHKSKSDNN